MELHQSLPPMLFVFFVICCLSSSTVVRSDSTMMIRLPTEPSQPVDRCPAPASLAVSCPVSCFRPDPVCGVNGVTYWCGCQEAHCAGVKVAKLGFCEVGNGGSAPMSAQALLLVHIVWLIVLGFSVLFGLF